MKVVFLADLIYFEDLYNFLEIASDRIEQAFRPISDLEKLYHNHPYSSLLSATIYSPSQY